MGAYSRLYAYSNKYGISSNDRTRTFINSNQAKGLIRLFLPNLQSYLF